MPEQEEEQARPATINEVIRTIGSSLDLRQVYEAFAIQLEQVVAFDRASVTLIEGDTLRFFALSTSVESELGEGTEVPLEGTSTEWVAAHKRAHIAYDLAKERQFSSEDIHFREGLRSAIHIPLLSRGEVIGALNLNSRQPNAYGEKERETLEQIAGPLAVAIENFRLYDEANKAAEELQASEAKFRNLFEHSRDAIFVADAETGIIVDCNLAASNMLGLPKEKVVGMHQAQLHPQEEVERYKELFRDQVEKGTAITDNLYVQRPDGDRIPVDILASAVEVAGRPMIQGVFRDITERRRVEEEVRESGAKLSALIDSAPDAIIVVDLSGSLLAVNAQAEALLGYSGEESIGKTAFELGLLPDEFVPMLKAGLERSRLGEATGPVEYELVRKDGSRVQVEAKTFPLVTKGRVEVTAMLRDVTERRGAEDALRASEEKLRVMFESIAEVIIVADLKGNIVEVNETALRLLGYGDKEEVIGRGLLEFIAEKDHDRALKGRADALEGGQSGSFECTLLAKDGREYEAEVNAALLRDSSGNPSGFIATIKDVTERKRAEDALRASEEKFRSLVEEINDAYAVVRKDQLIFANQRYAELYGYRLDELLGKSYLDFVAPESVGEATEILQKSLRGEPVPERYEVTAMRRDGTRILIEVSLRAITYKGRPAYSVIERDVTERRQMEEEIAQHVKRLEALHAVAAVSQTLELDNMLDGALGTVMDVMEADAGHIALVDVETRAAVIKAHRGLSARFLGQVVAATAGEEEVGRWLERREPAFGLYRIYGEPKGNRVLAAAQEEELQSFVAVPLWYKDSLLGALMLASRSPRRFSASDLELLKAIASEVAAGIENSRLFEEVSRAAITDGLTGLYNHRHFQERLEEEVARAVRFGTECSLIMLDLDYFKIYNDVFGHVAGDAALKRMGQVLRDYTRQVDITCRYGGEEFAAILPQTGPLYAYQAAERLRQATEEAFALEADSPSAKLTVSLGVASCPSDALSREDLIQCADRALRQAKERGRNQTRLGSELPDAGLERGEAGWDVAQQLKGAGPDRVYALAAWVDARDHYTYGHSQSVSRHAVALGRALGLSDERIGQLRTAALLHDIGKIGISDSIIRKPGPLDGEELETMRKHCELGATIVSHMPELAYCAPAIRHHHEWYDGSGYPGGLKGEDIPLEARIIAIADAFDTMTTPRSYRQRASPQEAVDAFTRSANTQFDPHLVEAFSQVVDTGTGDAS